MAIHTLSLVDIVICCDIPGPSTDGHTHTTYPLVRVSVDDIVTMTSVVHPWMAIHTISMLLKALKTSVQMSTCTLKMLSYKCSVPGLMFSFRLVSLLSQEDCSDELVREGIISLGSFAHGKPHIHVQLVLRFLMTSMFTVWSQELLRMSMQC